MADQQDRPEPDADLEDPRSKEVGEAGYSEEQPGDAGGGAPDADAPDDDSEAADRAPGTS